MRGGGFLYSRHRGWGFIGPLPTDLQKPPPQNNRAGELGPLPSQGVLLTQYTVFHSILCHYALRVNTLAQHIKHQKWRCSCVLGLFFPTPTGSSRLPAYIYVIGFYHHDMTHSTNCMTQGLVYPPATPYTCTITNG